MGRLRRFGGWMLTVCLLVTAVGCTAPGGGSDTPPLTEGFTAQAEIAYHELSLSGELKCSDDGKVQLTFSRPTSLCGVTIGWDGTDMTMELGGMSVRVEEDKVPDSALIKLILCILSDARTAAGNGTISGEADGLAYAVEYDPATGYLRSLAVPEEGMSVEFSQVAVYSADADTEKDG